MSEPLSPGARKLDNIAFGCVASVILLVALLILLRALFPTPPIKNPQPFDQQVWLANPKSEDKHPIRQRMVDDLLKRHDFSRSTLKDVEALLGPKTTTDKFPDWDLVYWLGPERDSLPLDSEWLAFEFDEKGLVKKNKLVTD